MTSSVSDEALNALIDGELAPEDQAAILRAANADPALQQRIERLRRLKAMVRQAYRDLPAAPQRAPVQHASRRAVALAGVALFAGGLAAGRWLIPGEAPAAVPGLVMQISDGDPAQWALALEQARAARRDSGRAPLDVVVIGYGAGLNMLRANSPLHDTLRLTKMSGVRILACGNTLRQSGLKRDGLAHEVEIAESGGPVEILRLQRMGYSYIHI